MIAVVGRESKLALWSIADPGAPFLVAAMNHNAAASAMTWFPGSATLASADTSGTIRLWRTALADGAGVVVSVTALSSWTLGLLWGWAGSA